MLNLEISAECVLKPLWVHLLLGFFCSFVGWFCFAFFQEEGASLHCRVDGASVAIPRPWHVI